MDNAIDGVEKNTWSVCRSVGRSVTILSRAKTAEPIEMPFGIWTRVGTENHVLDGAPGLRMRRGNFEGETLSARQMAG